MIRSRTSTAITRFLIRLRCPKKRSQRCTRKDVRSTQCRIPHDRPACAYQAASAALSRRGVSQNHFVLPASPDIGPDPVQYIRQSPPQAKTREIIIVLTPFSDRRKLRLQAPLPIAKFRSVAGCSKPANRNRFPKYGKTSSLTSPTILTQIKCFAIHLPIPRAHYPQ